MHLETIPELVRHWSETHPDRVWMKEYVDNQLRDHTWASAQAEIDAVAAMLEQRFGHGECMVILSRNRPHWILADMAIISSGNITVSMFTTLPAPTAQYILDFTEASVVFVGESPNWPAVREVIPDGVTLVTLPGVEIEEPHLTWEGIVEEYAGQAPAHQNAPDETMSLVFTSGTTGMPKGVIQTHESNLIPIRRFTEAFGLRQQPRYFSYLPLSHIAERQIVEFASIVTAGEIFFNEALETLPRDMQQARPHMFFGPPRIWEQLQQSIVGKFGGQAAVEQALQANREATQKQVLEGLGLSEVEYCLTAAAPTPPALIHWWENMGLTLMEGFGQTEAMGLIANSMEARKIGSIGRPVPGVEVKITEEGEMIVRAAGCTPGYYKQPDKTSELIRDGWIHTGDKAYIDEDGFIFITGRVKDYFKTIQGKFVAPPPIEGEFAKNPLVEQQCLLGRGYSKTVMVAILTESAQKMDPAEVEASVLETVEHVNAGVEKHARIGAVIIDDQPWTIENEILTPTLKIRREQVEKRYGEVAEPLARTAAEQRQVLVHWFGRD
jgi:long-chain acyl-CoA synthetase